MTYGETLDWLYQQLPAFQRIGGAAYKADLSNTLQLMELLNHPENSFPAIHVAGTNGKGSSSHMLASILQEAGYRVGLYTSPHLVDYRERIRVNGQTISPEEVVQFVASYQNHFVELGLSFFEMSVGMAFDHFRRHQVDLAVVEVGMGGRLDSTNVVHPQLCLITNIGMDHMQFLGNTLPAIAGEKAGIIKPGVPVVISEYQEETWPTFDRVAKNAGAPIFLAERETLPSYPSDLTGGYQKKNQRGVLAALAHLKEFPVTEDHIARGLLHVTSNTGLRGRWEQLHSNPLAFADTGHNEPGIAVLLEHIQSHSYTQLHLVWGMVGDKPADSVLQLLPKDAAYYFCAPAIPRAKNVDELLTEAHAMGLSGAGYPSVLAAYQQALHTALPTDLIVVCGSTFVVADLLKEISP